MAHVLQEVYSRLVLEKLRKGSELHRIASEREGHFWMLMPEATRVDDQVAEAVVINKQLVRIGSPVGRVSWRYVDKMEGDSQIAA